MIGATLSTALESPCRVRRSPATPPSSSPPHLEVPADPIGHCQKFYTWNEIAPLISASGSGLPVTVRVSDQVFSDIGDRLPRCSWSYNYATSELRISMPSAVHQAPANALNRLFGRDVLKPGLLTAEEESRAVWGSIDSVYLGANTSRIPCKKKEAVEKQPDWSLQVEHPSGRNYPTMVVEVGFSEGPKDLQMDHRHWVEGSNGKVKCVILVKIIEDTKRRQAHRANFQEYPYPASLTVQKHCILIFDRDRLGFLRTDHRVINVQGMTVPPGACPANDDEEIDTDFWVGPTSSTLTTYFTDSQACQKYVCLPCHLSPLSNHNRI